MYTRLQDGKSDESTMHTCTFACAELHCPVLKVIATAADVSGLL